MVRINLLKPRQLTDQHLIAEYNEILMLIGHTKKHPKINNPPKKYCLGKGHITFFKDKLKYLKKRHEQLKKEMKLRNYATNKKIQLTHFKNEQKKDWTPTSTDKEIIKTRIIEKINKKPQYYTYFGEHKSLNELIKLTLE